MAKPENTTSRFSAVNANGCPGIAVKETDGAPARSERKNAVTVPSHCSTMRNNDADDVASTLA
jgi:hypothetical protein